jgi:hypothetical protein
VSKAAKQLIRTAVFAFGALGLALVMSVPSARAELPTIVIEEPTNDAVREAFVETFTAAGLEHFIPIAECESGLEHYEDGRLLRNKQGSNARGILQIMTSAHPDYWRIRAYNLRFGTDYQVDDFDIMNDPSDYLRYGLLLAMVRGTQDWECAS